MAFGIISSVHVIMSARGTAPRARRHVLMMLHALPLRMKIKTHTSTQERDARTTSNGSRAHRTEKSASRPPVVRSIVMSCVSGGTKLARESSMLEHIAAIAAFFAIDCTRTTRVWHASRVCVTVTSTPNEKTNAQMRRWADAV